MTDDISDIASRSAECQRFDAQLADYLDDTCSESDRVAMDTHRAICKSCAQLVRELEQLVHDAQALPTLTASHDLWTGIDFRLRAHVTPLRPDHESRSPSETAASPAPRTITVRTFAIAATMLIAITSGVTWRLARIQSVRSQTPIEIAQTGATAPIVTSANAIRATDSVNSARRDLAAQIDSPVTARMVATSPADIDEIYLREIASLRRVVNERFADLDSVTVIDLRRNLAIIDAAIADSQRALRRSPRSRFLSLQLDRALETKLALMRRVALL